MILLILATFVCIIVGLIIYARWNFGTLEKMGLPVVKYHPLWGSTDELYTTVGGLNDTKWMSKYGPIFGVYEGRLPQVFICVPDLVRQICVKDAQYFDAKRKINFKDPVLNNMPDFVRPAEKWRSIRQMSTPAFSLAKLKMMNLPMIEATKDFIEGLKKKIRSSEDKKIKVPIDDEIHYMLTSLIARSIFTLQVGSGDNEEHKFEKLVQRIMKLAGPEISMFILRLNHSFPFMNDLFPTTFFPPEPVHEFVQLLKHMISERRRSGKRYNDVLDLTIDWLDRLDEPEFKKFGMDENTVLCQTLVFFVAAQDQVSTMVAALIYHATKDSEIEKKLCDEVDAVFAKHGGKIEHENLKEFVYLNACLQESLRLYTYFHRTERECTKEWKNEEYNLHLKPGQLVIFPIWAINRNPEFNERPNDFFPDRFLPENKDKVNIYASTSFGHGPRNCTGKPFALECMPIIAAYLIKELKFKKRADTKLEFVPGGPFFQPHEQIIVDVMER